MILVTGAKGQVGLEIIKQAKLGKLDLIGLDKASFDITDIESIKANIKVHRPAVIINAAAYTAVDKAEQEASLAYEVNTIGPKNLAKICKESSIVLIHISTDYVFDGNKIEPYRESDTPNPINVYGETKLGGENKIRSILNDHIIIRTSWVFSDQGSNFVKSILSLAQSEAKLKVVGDQHGSPTSASSIASIIIEICKAYNYEKKLQFGTYHFSGMPITTWFYFAKKIIDIAYNKNLIEKVPVIEEVTTEEYVSLSKKPINSSLSCDKIEEAFKIKPNNWEYDLQFVIDALQSQSS